MLPDEGDLLENDYNSFPNYGSTVSNGSLSRKKGLCMDDAISQTGFGIFNYILMFTSALTMAAFIIEMIGISFIFPVSQCDLHLTPTQKGILGASGYFGIICSSHLWGYLADTKGRRRVIQPTLLATSVVTIAASFVHNFYFLTILRFLTGFFISGSSATIYVYVGEFMNNARRSRAIMGSSVIFGIICIFMPFLAWCIINQDWKVDVPYVVTYKPWRLFLAMCSLPEILSFLIITFLPESPKFVLDQGKPEEAYKILQKMNRINNGRKAKLEAFDIYMDGESSSEKHQKNSGETMKRKQLSLMESVSIQTIPLFQSPYLFRTVLLCAIQFMAFFTCQGLNVFFTEISNRLAVNSNHIDRMMMCDILNLNKTHLTDVQGEKNIEVCITKLQTTTLLQELSLQILYASGYFIVSMLINRISKFPIIFTIFAGTGACGIACMLTDNPILQIVLFTVLQSPGVGSVALNTVTVEIYPTKLRAMAICIALCCGRLGSVAGSNMVAFLLEENCEFTFYLCGSTLIAAGVLTFFIPNIHQKVIKSDDQ